ncbi:MAG: lipocalin family protein [Desulfobacterales bacterium]|nr:lipocalin family protein [Desulfobacterales bacterium]
MTHRIFLLTALFFMSGCLGIPEGIEPIDEFEVNRYLGKWYEIARLDHSFERGLSRVSADYALRDDGGIRVVNRGFSEKKNQWKQAEGNAYFVQSPDAGYLKVSFFGPFYGSYVIFELDKEKYQYAYVSGPNRNYLWLLARTPEIDQEKIDRFIERSRELGFDVDNLIFVAHE